MARGTVWGWLCLATLPLLQAPATRTSSSLRAHTIEIRGMAFEPAVLTVHRGDTIVWINRDIVPHTATSSGNVAWDTGRLLQGEAGRIVPRRTGAIVYICAFHPTMKGTLIIR